MLFSIFPFRPSKEHLLMDRGCFVQPWKTQVDDWVTIKLHLKDVNTQIRFSNSNGGLRVRCWWSINAPNQNAWFLLIIIIIKIKLKKANKSCICILTLLALWLQGGDLLVAAYYTTLWWKYDEWHIHRLFSLGYSHLAGLILYVSLKKKTKKKQCISPCLNTFWHPLPVLTSLGLIKDD